MKQLHPKITCIAFAVLATVFAQAQTNALASFREQNEKLQGTNTFACCAKDDKSPSVENEPTEALLKMAGNGNAKAQYEVGRRYQFGKGVATNAVEAIKWYRKAAEQGLAEAQFALGLFMLAYPDIGVEPNLSEAGKWISKAAEQYRKVAEQGNAEAQIKLADCLELTKLVGPKNDAAEAVKWYRKAAEQGNAEAQRRLAECYRKGQGVERDKTEAVKWYQKAAEQGDAEAQLELAICYYFGKVVERNYLEVVKWCRMAADQGLEEAQCLLGICYENGYGVKKDDFEAVNYYRKAADQGQVVAQAYLGDCYYFGKGIEENKHKAVEWYRKAVDNRGNFDALGFIGSEMVGFELSGHVLRLGDCYKNGVGVAKDESEAVKLYRKVAEVGLTFLSEERGARRLEAMYRLADCYENGLGVEKSFMEATKWRCKAWFVKHLKLAVISITIITVVVGFVLWAIMMEWLGFIKLHRKAKGGDADAMMNVARYCSRQLFFLRKKASTWYHKAVEQYRKAAEQGDDEAQIKLGDCYRYGIGVEKNDDEATKWFRLAASQGNERATEKMKEMDSKD